MFSHARPASLQHLQVFASQPPWPSNRPTRTPNPSLIRCASHISYLRGSGRNLRVRSACRTPFLLTTPTLSSSMHATVTPNRGLAAHRPRALRQARVRSRSPTRARHSTRVATLTRIARSRPYGAPLALPRTLTRTRASVGGVAHSKNNAKLVLVT